MKTNFNRRLDLCRKNMLHAVYCVEQIENTSNQIAKEEAFVIEHIHDNLFLSQSKITKARTELEDILKGFGEVVKRHDKSK